MVKAQNVSGKVLTDLLAENAALKAKLEQAEQAKARKQTISYKVSPKGALAVYGLGRFPVTLYRQQWETLLTKAPEILAFIKANSSLLSVKE